MSFLSATRLRRASIVLSGAIAAALLLPLPAMAGGAPGTTPTITSPNDGDTITTSPVTVTATSTASKVRFIVGAKGTPVDQQTVDVVAGTASTTVDVFGATGATTIRASDCDLAGTVCNEVSEDTVSVTVNLTNPSITSPANHAVVGTSVDVTADAPGGALRFSVSDQKDFDDSAPFGASLSLAGKPDREFTLTVQQCNADHSVCGGDTDQITIIKDTKGPNWSNVSTSNRTVFPANDGYKDSTRLSAKVSEKSLGTRIEIRKAGGPIVRTIKLGQVSRGGVNAAWNGHKSNGEVAGKGKYLFRFVGTDVHGSTSKSAEKVVYVSDKKLVKKHFSKSVGAWGSKIDQYAGRCSTIVHTTRANSGRSWPSGVGLRSNSKQWCSGAASVALTLHAMRLGKALKYGNMRVSAYGGGSQKRPGPALLINVKPNGHPGAKHRLSRNLGWSPGDTVSVAKYLARGRAVFWEIGTANGFYYDVKKFKVTYTAWVLR